MKKLGFLLFCAILLEAASALAQITSEAFVCPPRDARVNTYWEWMNGNLSKEGITADLEYMKAANYGAAMIFEAAVGIPEGPVKYGSDEWREYVLHAMKEAHRLDIQLFMHNSPGYSGTGGPWITPEVSMKQLMWTTTVVRGGKKQTLSLRDLPQPITKCGFYRDARVIAYPAVEGDAEMFRDLVSGMDIDGESFDAAWLLDNDLQTEVRLEKGQTLTVHLRKPMTVMSGRVYRGTRETPLDPHDGPRDYAPVLTIEGLGTIACPTLRAMDMPGWLSCEAREVSELRITSSRGANLAELEFSARGKDDAIDPATVLNLTGQTSFSLPDGNWEILRMGYTTTGETVAAAPTAGVGLECDKLNRMGVDAHFERFLDPLLQYLTDAMAPTRLPLEGLCVDSWEAGKQDWTEGLDTAFLSRRGYDLTPWLPVIAGKTVADKVRSDQFVWDFNRTLCDLLLTNYVERFKDRCGRWGLKYAGEAYGDGNFESTEFAALQDFPMSEFWTHYVYGNIATTMLASSAAHLYGRKQVMCECYTGTPFNAKFTEHPYGMKALGDYIMTQGVNRFVYHATTHQPYTGSQPGNIMTMGPFGTHLDRTSTWARQFADLNLYNARCAYLLQEGDFVADILYIKGEDISSSVTNYNMNAPICPFGYRWDVGGTEALQLDSLWRNYKVVVYQPGSHTSPETLDRLRALEQHGIVVTDGRGLDSVLLALHLKPQFSYVGENKDAQIHFIMRQENGCPYFFVTNHRRRPERLTATFRADSSLVPELWDAMTGATGIAVPYEVTPDGTRINLSLEESGSVFVVFRPGNASSAHLQPVAPKATKVHGEHGDFDYDGGHDFRSTFTLECWAKPETFAMGGRGIINYPARQAKGHAQVGLSLGQNGVRVYERETAGLRLVLEAQTPIEGWTHVALTYEDGVPTLYLNGQEVGRGEASGLNCRPAVDVPQAEDQYAASFEGDNTAMLVYDYALPASLIAQHCAEGLPVPRHLGTALFALDGGWTVEFPAWSKAPASIELPQLQSLHKHADFNVKHFSGTAVYRTTFTLGKKQLKQLKVGRLVLNLGRVENMADVSVNGSPVQLVWKAPYAADITPWVHEGENTLVVEVTNLYPNRIIGDEHLPETYEYDEYGRLRQFPDWFRNNQVVERDRVLFLPWKHYTKDSPLLESGLLGPAWLELLNTDKHEDVL